jgi:hypothetical protein
MLDTYVKPHIVTHLESKISRLEHLLSAAPLTIYSLNFSKPVTYHDLTKLLTQQN